MKKILSIAVMALLALGLFAGAAVAAPEGNETVVPGQQTDDGSYPEGEVTGVYEFEENGWHYKVQYRGDFEGTPHLANGWIINHITNIDTGQKWFYLIVHESDPRYTGEGTEVWGDWEYHLRVRGNQPDPAANGVFDINRPEHHVNQ